MSRRSSRSSFSREAGRRPRASTARQIGAPSAGRCEKTRHLHARYRSPRRSQRRFRNCRPSSGRSGSLKVRNGSGGVRLRGEYWRRICPLRHACCHLRCTQAWLDLRFVPVFSLTYFFGSWKDLRYPSSLTCGLYNVGYESIAPFAHKLK